MDVKVSPQGLAVLAATQTTIIDVLKAAGAEAALGAGNKPSVAPKPADKGQEKDEESSKEKTHPVPVGSKCATKDVYQVRDPDNGGLMWVDELPDLKDPVENADSAGYALLIRNKVCRDGRKKLALHSIVVQSPILKRVLGDVLKDYPGVTTGLGRLTFKPPFAPFVHRWHQLEEAKESQVEEEAKAHMDLLFKVLEAELKETITARDDLVSHGVMTFELLWTIFQPGKMIFTTMEDEDRVLQLKDSNTVQTDTSSYFQATGESIDWDGDKFGRRRVDTCICSFPGTMAINELSTYPLAFHTNTSKVRKDLVKRGRKFAELCGYHYKAYKGIALGVKTICGTPRYSVSGRIIIDTLAYHRFQPNSRIHLNALGSNRLTEYSDEEDDISYCGSDDSGTDGNQQNNAKGTHALTDDQLLICTSLVRGYSLKSKKWLSFFVKDVTEIQWSEGAFDSLVIPQDQKELVLAFSESQAKYKENFDDVIEGKGKGIVMLLHGPPGVGKTLTAESVAETMRVPLYCLAAGDVGLESAEVETKLSNIMEMTARWNAVLLLDEADVFLEQRTLHDLERNKLVSIFLRILEYYEGIMFLTSNRVETFDAAFQSRIHVSLEYQELSALGRRQVWANFLNNSPQGSEISSKQVDKLAEMRMNGRQIKNILKTAQLLASRRNMPLRQEHISSVINITKQMQ